MKTSRLHGQSANTFKSAKSHVGNMHWLLVAAITCCIGLMASTPVTAESVWIKGATTAYYFDKNGKYIAGEVLKPEGRQIEKAKDISASQGFLFVLKMVGQTVDLPKDKLEISGSIAKYGIYTSLGPNHLVILGIEDLTNLKKRIIEPLGFNMGPVAKCCCGLIPCPWGLCCPPNCPTEANCQLGPGFCF